jgi:hypothetical protein
VVLGSVRCSPGVRRYWCWGHRSGVEWCPETSSKGATYSRPRACSPWALSAAPNSNTRASTYSDILNEASLYNATSRNQRCHSNDPEAPLYSESKPVQLKPHYTASRNQRCHSNDPEATAPALPISAPIKTHRSNRSPIMHTTLPRLSRF